MTDQQSADILSCRMGSRYISTPAIDRLAEQGMFFSRAYCASPLCVPSRMAMFSGRYPHETGVSSNLDISADVSAFNCLGTVFRDAGYDTGYVGKWHIPFDPDDRQKHGFEFMENIRCNGADLLNSEAAIRFMQMERDTPFFLVASYNNPHNICEWARGIRGGELPDARLEHPPSMDKCPPLKLNHSPAHNETDAISLLRKAYQSNPMFPVGDFGEQDWREYLWAYYRMIESVDKQVGVLLDWLGNSGKSDNTVIVFTSDHGDAQGAHLWNQKTVFYDESSRVPFIISCPAKLESGVSERLCQVGIDLMPTLCDAAGIAVPSDIPGISLLDESSLQQRSWIAAETCFVQGAVSDLFPPLVDGRMIRSQQFKSCVYDTGDCRESLVDMQNDPGEMRNLAGVPEYAEVLAEHRDYLSSFCSLSGDEFPVACG
jgi:choline-sulfatase